jgi:hypothetical protein
MSRALGSAKQRRAGVSFQENIIQSSPQPNSQPNPTQPFQSTQNGLTLPQVIQLVDTRLVKLERHMIDSGGGAGHMNASEEILGEMDERFNILASELQELKDVVYKLQTYTMDVNKTMMETFVKPKTDKQEKK